MPTSEAARLVHRQRCCSCATSAQPRYVAGRSDGISIRGGFSGEPPSFVVFARDSMHVMLREQIEVRHHPVPRWVVSAGFRTCVSGRRCRGAVSQFIDAGPSAITSLAIVLWFPRFGTHDLRWSRHGFRASHGMETASRAPERSATRRPTAVVAARTRPVKERFQAASSVDERFHVRCGFVLDGDKAEAEIERRRLRAGGFQATDAVFAARFLEQPPDQRRADAVAARGSRDVDPPETADPFLARIGIAIERADFRRVRRSNRRRAKSPAAARSGSIRGPIVDQRVEEGEPLGDRLRAQRDDVGTEDGDRSEAESGLKPTSSQAGGRAAPRIYPVGVRSRSRLTPPTRPPPLHRPAAPCFARPSRARLASVEASEHHARRLA